MVATQGRGWILSPSAKNAVTEADEIAPHRSHASDGSIGDQAHAGRSSFHNPQAGYVDAVDITHDPLGGFDAHHHADVLIATLPAWLDHVISNRRIASAARGWVWRPYTGSNPHDKHIHVANLRNDRGRFYQGPIFDGDESEEDDMNADQDARLLELWQLLKGSGGPGPLNAAIARTDANASIAAGKAPAKASLQALSQADLEAIAEAVNDEAAERQKD